MHFMTTGGIVDEDKQGTGLSTALEPVMGGTIGLYQLAQTGAAGPMGMDVGLPAPFGPPESISHRRSGSAQR